MRLTTFGSQLRAARLHFRAMTQAGPSRCFTILYTSREGSSAMIGKLQKHVDIHVPCFEELDANNLRKVVPEADAKIGEILDAVFTEGVIPGKDSRYAGQSVVGFKWRPFGGAPAVEALLRNRCLGIYLYRRNTLRRALSMLFKPEHIQFKVEKMSPEEREETLRRTHAETFSVQPGDLATLIKRYTDQKSTVWRHYGRNLSDKMFLEYELFETRPTDALNLILDRLDLPRFEHEPESPFVKTMRGDIETQCENLEEVMRDKGVQVAISKYEKFLQRIGVESSV